jgi:antibiotic biosynthesis monooxygenase (ABM) superfamily enzyme
MTEFSTSFATTNCIESCNADWERTTGYVKHWMNSPERFHWIGAGLVEAEERMRKVNYARLEDVLKRAFSTAINNPNFN